MRLTDFARTALVSAREHLETALNSVNDAMDKLEKGDPAEAGKVTTRATVETGVALKRLESIRDKASDGTVTE